MAEQLSEFSPRNPGLLGLNVNRGAEVKIRLRLARDDDSFYDWNHILGTMLHEVRGAAAASLHARALTLLAPAQHSQAQQRPSLPDCVSAVCSCSCATSSSAPTMLPSTSCWMSCGVRQRTSWTEASVAAGRALTHPQQAG